MSSSPPMPPSPPNPLQQQINDLQKQNQALRQENQELLLEVLFRQQSQSGLHPLPPPMVVSPTVQFLQLDEEMQIDPFQQQPMLQQQPLLLMRHQCDPLDLFELTQPPQQPQPTQQQPILTVQPSQLLLQPQDHMHIDMHIDPFQELILPPLLQPQQQQLPVEDMDLFPQLVQPEQPEQPFLLPQELLTTTLAPTQQQELDQLLVPALPENPLAPMTQQEIQQFQYLLFRGQQARLALFPPTSPTNQQPSPSQPSPPPPSSSSQPPSQSPPPPPTPSEPPTPSQPTPSPYPTASLQLSPQLSSFSTPITTPSTLTQQQQEPMQLLAQNQENNMQLRLALLEIETMLMQ